MKLIKGVDNIKKISNKNTRLFRAGYKTVVNDDFVYSLNNWKSIKGDWHFMTVDSNVDQSAGIEGGQALNCAGAYEHGSIMRKSVFLKDYSELTFEHYVQNPLASTEPNALVLLIDDAEKLKIMGPSPWQINEPIGLSPGEHLFTFRYSTFSSSKKKAVIDSFVIKQSKYIDCLITKSSPPKPERNFTVQSILRGYKRVQQSVSSDTNISFTAMFESEAFEDFILNIDEIHYYQDEFGKVYRGVFIDTVEPESIVKGKIYIVNLSLLCHQKAGVGFV